jgi:hypothetical protein
MSGSALEDFLYGTKPDDYWLDQRYDSYSETPEILKEKTMSTPTPKTVKEATELLQSTEPITDEQKEAITGLLGTKKAKVPFVPKPHLTQSPFRGNAQLQALRDQLATKADYAQKGRK